MTKPDLFIDGKRLEVVKRIGKGGEGDVYLLAGNDKKAVKVYRDEKRAEREAKVRAMVHHRLAASSNLVAFPEVVVTTQSGHFAGFAMRLVEGFRELHELYGPRSRKLYYPKADFRFLVRAAANTARAVGQVHSSSCVIGDLNESGLLVSSEATVAMIDADSFQFEANGNVYPCLVGKPDFTAPELHGRSLAGVARTKAHDHFGLSVAIFQLLFMGRHPYAGQQKGSDLSLEQMIASNLFAYSKRRQTGVTPPGVLPSLDDFTPDIGDAFERAFGLEPAKRPSAAEWANMLHALEGRLSRCGIDGLHYYPSSAKGCPWCRMEGATGVVLFLSSVAAKGATAAGVANFDVEKAWIAIKAIALPNPSMVTPKLARFTAEPSQEAKSAKSGSLKYRVLGFGVAAVAIAAWVNAPDGFLLWIGALIFAWFQFGKTAVDPNIWRNRYATVDTKWDDAISAWRGALGISAVSKLRNDLEAAVNEFRSLPTAKSQALTRLRTERHARQLNEYLDRFLIRRASISGIGQEKTITLASFGVESAADIRRNAILTIPGFGPATADKLMTWRAQHEKRFVYNPAPNQSDIASQAKVDVEYARWAAKLAEQIAGGQAELVQASSSIHLRVQQEDKRLTEIARERAQIEADLAFLGIAKPHKPAALTMPYRPPRSQSPPAGKSTGGITLCPNCGAGMVRRTARRGSRRGNQFWGCSRYPSCRGTRP